MSWVIVSDVRFRRVLDEGMVIRQASHEVLGLNTTGLRILELLRQGLPVDELVARLAEEQRAPEEQVAADVAEFLLELEEAGVLERNAGAVQKAGRRP